MDTATLIGLIVGTLLISLGIAFTPGSDIGSFVNLPAFLIVVGGTGCALLVNFPLKDILGVGRIIKFAFKPAAHSPVQLIADFRRFADIARRDGILALEKVTQDIKDPFLLRGVQLAVAGTDPEVIQSLMRTEMEYMADRHDRGIKIVRQFGTYAPAFGMIGTLIGLVVMMRNLNDPASIGPSMAVALLTTFYGVILANLVGLPLAEKLTIRNNEEMVLREMMVKGLMSIQSGDSPRIVEQKLKIILPPAMREQSAMDLL